VTDLERLLAPYQGYLPLRRARPPEPPGDWFPIPLQRRPEVLTPEERRRLAERLRADPTWRGGH
jgi:hypothetical protein